MSKKNKTDRRIDICHKLMQIGESLVSEGEEKKDDSIAQVGTFVILISSLLLNKKDIRLFSELCMLFISKNIVDEVAYIDDLKEDELTSYEYLIKKMGDYLDKGKNKSN